MSAADNLRKMAETFEERSNVYGNAHERFGDVMRALYPTGLHVDTRGGFIRLGLIVQILNKVVRFTHQPRGHKDSAHDLAVYSAMLECATEE